MTSMMQTGKVPAVLSVLAVVIASAALWRAHDAQPTTSAAPSLHAATGPREMPASNEPAWQSVGSEVRMLRAELAILRRELTLLRTQPARTPTTAAAGAAAAPIEAVSSEELSARLDRTLQREPQTLEALRLANVLGAAIVRVLPQRASLQQIACRASLCRAEVTYASAEQLQSFMETQLDGAEAAFWQGPVLVQTPANSSPQAQVQATLYLGRAASGFEVRESD